MYKVERRENDIIISGENGRVVYTTTKDSFIVIKEDVGLTVKCVKDLSDSALVLALAKAVRIITDNPAT